MEELGGNIFSNEILAFFTQHAFTENLHEVQSDAPSTWGLSVILTEKYPIHLEFCFFFQCG